MFGRLKNRSGNLKHILKACSMILWLLMGNGYAQKAGEEKGYPFMKYYSSNEYKAHTQNFASAQDQRGLLYFGNFAGILEYDGVNWRLIQTTRQTKVSALCVDKQGRVYAGALGEMGYLAPDTNGVLKFNSITEKLPVSDQQFNEVISCYPSDKGVFFITSGSIFLWDGKNFKSWKVSNDIVSGFLVNDILYFQVKGEGLKCIDNNLLKMVPGGNVFTSAVEIRAMFPFRLKSILIATDNQGLYLQSQEGIVPFPTGADAFIKENKITCGWSLMNNEMIFGTLRKGLIILNEAGEKVLVLDQKSGLVNEYVTNLFTDQEHSLWVTLNDGLAHIDYPSPFGQFGQGTGLNGGVLDFVRHQGILYAATYQGLFKFDAFSATFSPVPGILTACWSVISAEGKLIAASSQGVYELRNGKPVMVAEGFSLTLHRSLKNPPVLFVGQTDGVLELTVDNASVRKTGKLAGITQEIREIVEDSDGRIWFSGPSGDILMLNVENKGNINHFGEKEGLPASMGKHLNIVAGQAYITTPQGIYVYNSQENRFIQSTFLPADSTGSKSWINRLVEDDSHNVWTQTGDEKQLSLFLKQTGNTYQRDYVPFLPVADRVNWIIYPESKGITWMGGPEGALRYDRNISNVSRTCPAPLIRKVMVNNDSVVFFGAFADSSLHVTGIQQETDVPSFKPHENTLRFEFAVPAYHVKGGVLFQYFLEGFDKIPSEWTTASQKEYTNLSKGRYIFKVKAKDIYGNISTESVYAFRIRTPWYSSILAYLFYVLAAGLLLYLFVRWRSQQLLKEKKSLENLIMERTAEVVQQKEEMEKQSQELAYKNEELERINNVVKSINAQIEFTSLLQSILEKFMIIRGVERASAIVYDKARESYRYKASVGWDFRQAVQQSFSLNELEEKYLQKTEEISEDVFTKTDFSSFIQQEGDATEIIPKAMLIMVIRLDNKVGGFLLLENTVKKDAFQANDLSFISNLRQHIISAFIKTGILEDLQKTLDELKDTQDQLVQSEKLASLGQLTAGIAHEIQNPLNFVNNFASLSMGLADEMKENIEKLKDTLDKDTRLDMEEVTDMMASNSQKILEHGKRAESIVKGMLQHSRGRTGEFELVEINNMVSEYVNLAYHGMRAKDKSFNTAIRTNLDPAVGKSYVVPQDLSRVILNIVNNSCYAVDQKAKSKGSDYRPEIVVTTRKVGKNIQIIIHDNGTGIPQSVVDKIFNPFFTTKPTGQGTGLGLSMSFDIINQIHKGKLEVKTEEGEFTEFIITIPENLQK
jgi:signal transduction histidine kinase/ligand-binding sensor domain-containing protein